MQSRSFQIFMIQTLFYRILICSIFHTKSSRLIVSVTSVSVRMVAVSSKTNEVSSAVFGTWKKNVTLFSGKPMRKSFRWLVVHKFRTPIGQQNEHIDDQRLNLEEDSTCLASFASRSTMLLGFRSLLFFCSQIPFVLFLFWEALMLRTMLWTYNRSLHTRVLSLLLVLEQCEIFLWSIVKGIHCID